MSCHTCALPRGFLRLLHGAAGLTRAALGVDRAPEHVIAERRAACRRCPDAQPCDRIGRRVCSCKLCGCLISAKTALSSESCPADRW